MGKPLSTDDRTQNVSRNSAVVDRTSSDPGLVTFSRSVKAPASCRAAFISAVRLLPSTDAKVPTSCENMFMFAQLQ